MLNEIIQKPAYSVAEISAMTSLSKTFLRNEIKAQNLKAKSFGRRVLILNADLQMYLESKPNYSANDENNGTGEFN